MCEVIDKVVQRGREEGIQEGRTAGKEEQALESAIQMIKDNLPVDKIAVYTGLPQEKVKALAEELAVAVRK